MSKKKKKKKEKIGNKYAEFSKVGDLEKKRQTEK